MVSYKLETWLNMNKYFHTSRGDQLEKSLVQGTKLQNAA